MIKQIRIAVSAVLLFACSTFAQQTQPIVVGERFVIHSEVLDEDRSIVVSLPPGYVQGDTRYPVIYLLDGPSNLNHTTASKDVLARSNRMPQMIIVGIGNTDRRRDMTPSRVEQVPTSGGADAFLSFIKTELIPHIESNYRTQPYRVLIGHSFGGLFAIHTMIHQPDTFDAYLMISPTLLWDNSAPIEGMSTFLDENPDYRGSLYVTMANEGGAMQADFERFVALLESRAPQTLHWGSKFLPDEDHGSTVLRSTYHALKTLFSDWQPTEALATSDVEAIKKHFAAMSKKYKFQIAPEQPINQLGYRLLQSGEVEKAIEIFKFNIELHPESANVYDSLGEAYETTGQIDSAAASYEKAVKRGRRTNDPNLAIYETNFNRVRRSNDAEKQPQPKPGVSRSPAISHPKLKS